MKKLLIWLGLGFLSVACIVASVAFVLAAEVPEGIAESPPVLVMGSKFVFQEINLVTGKIVSTYTWIVKEKKEYEKKQAYWIDSSGGLGESFIVYDMNLNWRAFILRGEEQESASSCIQYFSWPLKVGRKWRTSYDYWDRLRGRTWRDQSEPVTVESYEEVKVPSGTFRALKIIRSGQRLKVTQWYAPSVGFVVKRETERSADHYLGRSKCSVELVEYNIP